MIIKNPLKTKVIYGLLFVLIFIPFGWRFWISPSRLSYLAPTITPADAAALVGLILGSLIKPKFISRKASLLGWLILPVMAVRPDGFWLIRPLFLTIGFIPILSLIRPAPKLVKSIIMGLAILALLEFILLNFICQCGRFSVLVGQKRVFLAALYLQHPNVLAAIVYFLIVWLRLFYPTSLVFWAGFLVAGATGSVSAFIGLSIIALGRFKRLLALGAAVAAGLFLTSTKEAFVNRLILPNLSRQRLWLGGGGRGVFDPGYKNPLTADIGRGWFFEPVHNLPGLILTAAGIVGLIVFLWLLGWLYYKKDRLLVASLLPWILLDHLLLTSFQVQPFLALITASIFARAPDSKTRE